MGNIFWMLFSAIVLALSAAYFCSLEYSCLKLIWKKIKEWLVIVTNVFLDGIFFWTLFFAIVLALFAIFFFSHNETLEKIAFFVASMILLIGHFYGVFIKLSPALFLKEKSIYFYCAHYFENVNDRCTRTTRALLKMLPLTAIFISLTFIWFERSKINIDRAVDSCKIDPKELEEKKLTSAKDSQQLKCIEAIQRKKSFNESIFIDERAREIITMILSLITLVVAAYWSLDQIFGRVWQHSCALYKELLVTKDEEKKKRDILRLNLCIDIMDHGMWNTKQFQTFFGHELSVVYKALISHKIPFPVDEDEKNSTDEFISEYRNYMNWEQYLNSTEICCFIRYTRRRLYKKKILILPKTGTREMLSWLSEYLEEECDCGKYKDQNRIPRDAL